MHLRASAVPPSACLLLAAAGCGGGGAVSRSGPAATTPVRPPATARPPALPAGVPRSADGPAEAAATRTIRRWTDALRAGRVRRAAAFWGTPARVQNGTPVIVLRTHDDVLLFNDSLSCGAVLTGTGAAGGYTIATFRLTERPGGACGGGVGARARTAIRVRGGRIVAWYRLPETTPAPVL